MSTLQTVSMKQPPVFKLAFFTAMFERFAFYLLTDLLVLYMSVVYHFSDARTFTLFAIFNALVYITPALGGYLADNFLGIRRSLIVGLIFEGVGLFVISLPNPHYLSFGLACIIVGVGFFKVAPTQLMARSYKAGDSRIDSGYTLYYMAINVGSFFSAILAGIIQQYLGWHIVFLVASLSLVAALASYVFLRQTAKLLDSAPGNRPLALSRWFLLIVGIIVAVACATLLVSHTNIAQFAFFIVAAILCCYFLFEIVRSKREEKRAIIAALMLIVIGLVFYIFYYQAFTSITLFVKRSVVRHIFGINIPTVTFLLFNPFWILTLSPILAAFYEHLARKNRDFAITTKFVIGLFLMCLCFFSLYFSTFFHNAAYKVSALWIVLAYLLYSFSELLIGALGVAVVAHIAPKRLYGVMMGTWFLVAMGLSSSLSGIFAKFASVPETITNARIVLHIYGSAFMKFGFVVVVVAIIAAILNPYLKRIAQLN